MFSIAFLDDPLEYPFDDTSIPAAPGCLILGMVREDFLANLALWSKADYEAHWKRELEKLLRGCHKVALVVSYNDPKESDNLEIWPVFREGEIAHLQNHIPWYHSYPRDFDISKMSEYLRERRVINEDGNTLSEWEIPLRDIESFLSTLP